VRFCDIVKSEGHGQARTTLNFPSSGPWCLRSVLEHGVGCYSNCLEARASRGEPTPDGARVDPRPDHRSHQRSPRGRCDQSGTTTPERRRGRLETLEARACGPTSCTPSPQEATQIQHRPQSVNRPRDWGNSIWLYISFWGYSRGIKPTDFGSPSDSPLDNVNTFAQLQKIEEKTCDMPLFDDCNIIGVEQEM
jgi:hypothetical protein